MRTSSAKAKGRRLQQEVATRIRNYHGLPETDIVSRPMGSRGTDIMLSERALEDFPYSIECKNTEKINIWNAYAQAKENATEKHPPLVIFSKNRSEILVCLSLEDFLKRKLR